MKRSLLHLTSLKHGHSWSRPSFNQSLLQRIQAALKLTTTRGTVVDYITRCIQQGLSSKGVPNVDPASRIHSCTFQIDWDPIQFLQQQYPRGVRQPISEVITLVGSSINAQSSIDVQALTCGQYMRQTWPSTGLELLQGFQQAIFTQESHDSKAPYRRKAFSCL
jgi:hypothetical protein